MDTLKLRKRMPATALFDPAIVLPAIGQAFVKLNPRTLVKNPVMFVLEVVTLLTSALWVVSYYEHPLVGFSVEPVTMDQAVDVLTAIPELPVICIGDTLCVLPSTLSRHETAGSN